ncbi:hypothetical protein B0T18DRAFT_426645 [Schizothecium vesticola]|uniref:Uncharacterized protein n=1 Tax=Schizothecium vesticola TaxID=314040 RepID=A0AA40F6W4_9PEZI|nr:hypothetical protein B0T18DRAFT_426645 [Schizothecium vesticola]
MPAHFQLRPSVERDDAEVTPLDISRMDDDPITYFLTPAQPSYGYADDAMDFEMDFDAGIEDAKRPAPIVRSVSPSSLGGLSLPPPPRISTPPRQSESPDLDHDMPSIGSTPEDAEEYIHFAARGRPSTFGLPFSLRDFTASKPRKFASTNRPESPPTSAPHHPGRPGQRKSRPRALTPRRSPHAWRSPSPDVWSIQEETEEALQSDIEDGGGMEGERTASTGVVHKSKVIDIPAAKPKKRVRFVLPVPEREG